MNYQTIDQERSMLSGETLWAFCCPACKTHLKSGLTDSLMCPQDGMEFIRENNIWRFVLPGRMEYFKQFISDYETIRTAEGRGSTDPEFYRLLPDYDLTGIWSEDWRIRARSYQALKQLVLLPMDRDRHYPLKILDIGAGNGWLSNKLAGAGYMVCAIDLLTNPFDGLGAYKYYETKFTSVQAEFDRLPLCHDQVDLAIFNASLHYAVDYLAALSEAQRVLRPDGTLVIMDTPLYRQHSSGDQMVAERENHFQRKYGFKSNSIPSQNYLTYEQINSLGEKINVTWRLLHPHYGFRWRLKPWLARLRGWREPAQFILIEGKQTVERSH